MHPILGLMLGAMLLVARPVQAQAPDEPPKADARPEAHDPIVCRKVPQPGSRVSLRKECRLLSEWLDRGRARPEDEDPEQDDCGHGVGGWGCDLERPKDFGPDGSPLS